jgi:hypothetical protein
MCVCVGVLLVLLSPLFCFVRFVNLSEQGGAPSGCSYWAHTGVPPKGAIVVLCHSAKHTYGDCIGGYGQEPVDQRKDSVSMQTLQEVESPVQL